MSYPTWECCRFGLEGVMANWRKAPGCLDGCEFDDPPKFIGVSNSATAPYMNSTLKYEYVETVDGSMLRYKHFKDKHDELLFRHVVVKALSLRAFRTDDPLFWELAVYSGFAGDLLVRVRIDRQIKIAACKTQILKALVKADNCTPQTILLLTDPNENNGRKKISSILDANHPNGLLEQVSSKRSASPDVEKKAKKAKAAVKEAAAKEAKAAAKEKII